ncbi:FAD-dependent thymidylate synthase [Pantoea vagans]|uniref:FAD-dependent thymidylate synthase n=1 Tax=Pantoea vagans TaxID=470934 RepID=UPI00076B1158|nr:FAD-dependent thymidylate synthase [Pantoea vagans]AMG59513.1 thymidylate synthase (FAD) [Pantoea vagans]
MIKISTLSVSCLSHPTFDVDTFIDFLESQGLTWVRSKSSTSAEELVEASGRLCYMSFGRMIQSPRDNSQYILNLINQGHESVLEHINWTFLLTGVSRAFTHQLVRHRVGFAYSQLSQQYHDESDAEFVVPPEVAGDEELFLAWKTHVESCVSFYKKSINNIFEKDKNFNLSKKEKLRALRTASRSILPNSTETKIIVTANARAIRHFLKMRGSIEGDHEMRMVSEKIYNIVSLDAPAVFQDFILNDAGTNSARVVKLE